MNIDKFVVLESMINFMLFFLVFKFLLYKPVNKMITTRENEISDRLINAENDEKKAEELRIQNEEHIKNAKEEGKVIVEEFKVKAEKISADIIKESRDEAQLLLERAKVEINREKDKAKDELKQETVNLAVLLSVKAIEGTINEEDHRRLINDFLAKVGV